MWEGWKEWPQPQAADLRLELGSTDVEVHSAMASFKLCHCISQCHVQAMFPKETTYYSPQAWQWGCMSDPSSPFYTLVSSFELSYTENRQQKSLPAWVPYLCTLQHLYSKHLCCCIVGLPWMLCSSQISVSLSDASTPPQSLFNWALGSAHLITIGTNVRHLKIPKSAREQQVFSWTGLWRRQLLSTRSNGQRQGGSANNMVTFICWVPLSQQMLLQCLMFPSRSITANSVAWGYVCLHRWRADVPANLLVACSRGIWLS